jgi:hypothetical protein
MSKQHSETFLAFHKLVDGESSIQAAIEYDLPALVDERLQLFEPGELDVEEIERALQVEIKFVQDFKRFAFTGRDLSNPKQLRIAFRRVLAVLWLLDSTALTRKDKKTGLLVPMTLEELGRLPLVKCSRCALSLLAQRYGKSHGIQARVQKRVSTKPNYARAAKRGWKKRRAREAKR